MFLFVCWENIDKQATLHDMEATQYNILNRNLNRNYYVGNDSAIVV